MNKQQIPSSEVSFHPHSFSDHDVRLFRWNGQIYRGVVSKRTPYFTQLFQDGVIERLTKQGLLIESELTDLAVDGYSTVVRHRTLPFVSYANEWCAALLKQAALTLVDLAIELTQSGLTLGDGHPWNIMIDTQGCNPIFVDLGSLAPIDHSHWTAYDEFCRHCLYPLILMSEGQHLIARLLMCQDGGVVESTLSKLIQSPARFRSRAKRSLVDRLESTLRHRLPDSYRQQLKQVFQSVVARSANIASPSTAPLTTQDIRIKSHFKFLESVRREVEAVSVLPIQHTLKNQNDEKNSLIDLPLEQKTIKQQNVYKILDQLKPKSVLDIGCYTGWYSKLAAHLGSQVVAFDIDETCITQLYYDAHAQKLPILPLVMDFSYPTPSCGLMGHRQIAATERLRCDLVLALGLIPELVSEQRLSFDQFIPGLATFSKRWVIVEFIAQDDPAIANSDSRIHGLSWYTSEHFIRVVKQHFRNVEILPSDAKSRILVVCEK